MASFLLEDLAAMMQFTRILDFNDAKYLLSSAKSTNHKMDFEKASLAFQICVHDFIAKYLFFTFYFIFNNFTFTCFIHSFFVFIMGY